MAEKERILKASTTKIAQVDENLLQIEEQLEKLRLQRLQKEADTDQIQMKKERFANCTANLYFNIISIFHFAV